MQNNSNLTAIKENDNAKRPHQDSQRRRGHHYWNLFDMWRANSGMKSMLVQALWRE